MCLHGVLEDFLATSQDVWLSESLESQMTAHQTSTVLGWQLTNFGTVVG